MNPVASSTTHARLDGQVALVTGANTGIGLVTARELAVRGAHVFLACRSEARTRPVLEAIRALGTAGAAVGKVEFLPLDLGDLDSVDACADQFLQRGLPLHLLIANAGLAGQRGLTASGFELTFGTCHVGHFRLTQRLLECMKASAPGRIVVVSSKAHRHAKGIDFAVLRQSTQSAGGLKEYAVAKLANVLFAAELARRLEGSGITTYALHPGVVASEVWRSLPRFLQGMIKGFMLTPEQGAATSLYCATEPALASQSGLYYDNCQVTTPSPVARDEALAGRLWRESETWLTART